MREANSAPGRARARSSSLRTYPAGTPRVVTSSTSSGVEKVAAGLRHEQFEEQVSGLLVGLRHEHRNLLADQADGAVRAGRDRGPGQCRVLGVLVHHRRAAGRDDGVVVDHLGQAADQCISRRL